MQGLQFHSVKLDNGRYVLRIARGAQRRRIEEIELTPREMAQLFEQAAAVVVSVIKPKE